LRNTIISIIWLGLILTTVFYPCSSANGVHLISVCTCQDVKQPDIIPIGIQDKFNQNAEAIHAVIVMDSVKPETRIKGSWVSVDAIEIPDYQIDSAEVKAVSAEVRAHFALSRPANGWPVGNYRLDLYVNDEFSTSVPFSIQQENIKSNAERKSTKNDMDNNPKKKGAESDLIGTWYCRMEMGTSVLVFQSKDKLALDDQPANYKIVPGALRVTDDYGTEDYPYKLKNGKLTISFPEGYELEFVKSSDETNDQDESLQGQYDDIDESESDYSNQPNNNSNSSNDLMRHFAGTWWNASTNTETNVSLTADGRYYENYTASYSGGSNDQYGNETMNWGAAGDQKASGRWTVQGTRERGVLTIIYPNGNQRAINYQVHVENGEYYWGEYYFNGDLYGKK
jgi:hypothetical protein